MSLTIKCDRCECEVQHVCNRDLKEAVKNLFRFKRDEGFPEALKRGNAFLSAEDKEAIDKIHFFTETYLYALLGKEDARSLLAYVNNVIRAAGLDPDAIASEVWHEIDEEGRAEEKRLEQVEENRRKRAVAMQPVSKTPLPNGYTKWEYVDARGWDDAVSVFCNDNHNPRKRGSGHHPVKGSIVLSHVHAECSKCKVVYALPVDTFKARFITTDRTPSSWTAVELAAELGSTWCQHLVNER